MKTTSTALLSTIRLVLLVALVLSALLACKAPPKTDNRARPATSEVTPAPSAPRPKTALELVAEKATLREAIEHVKGDFEDMDNNDDSRGTLLLAYWAKDYLTRPAVDALPATTIRAILKDSASERGKRLCVGGQVVGITRSTSELWSGKKVWEGILVTDAFDAVRYFAVGETGAIVKGTRATLCGVATGRYSYSNVRGGTTHGVSLVGEFRSYEP